MGEVKDSDSLTASASSSSEHEVLPTPTFILMGKTGSGKSSFIKLLDGTGLPNGERPDVNSGIDSATTQAAPYRCHLNGKPIILIDTPGFDDSARDNINILVNIVSYLVYLARCRDRFPLHGVIFLHDISETRFSGSQKKTLSILRQICGSGAMGNVIVGTTMWNPEGKKRFAGQEKREADILKEHWGGIHSTVRLFDDDVDAAAGIVTALTALPPVNLLVQDEMQQTGHILGATTVGKTIFIEGTDESKRLRRQGRAEIAWDMDNQLKALKDPFDLTLLEKVGLALAAPIILAAAAVASLPVGVIYTVVQGINKLFGR